MVKVKTETRTERDGIHHRFSDLVMSVPLQKGFKRPIFGKYHVLSNAEEHQISSNNSTNQHYYKRRRDQSDEEKEDEEELEHETPRTTRSCRGRRNDIITFNDDDFTGIDAQEDDPMVITVELESLHFDVKRVLIDQGSSANILSYNVFLKRGLPDLILRPFEGALNGEVMGEIKGCIILSTKFGEREHAKTINVSYLVIDSSVTDYNIIIGRPALYDLGAIVSTPHLTMKYPLPNGNVGVIRADQKTAIGS